MVSVLTTKPAYRDPAKEEIVAVCISTDTKPVDVANGSIMIEMDTSKVYFYNEDGTTWEEF